MVSAEMPCPTPSAPSNGEPAVAVPSNGVERLEPRPLTAREKLRDVIVAQTREAPNDEPNGQAEAAFMSLCDLLRDNCTDEVGETMAAFGHAWADECRDLRLAWEAFERDVPPTPAEDDLAHAIVADLAAWAADDTQCDGEIDDIAARAHALVDRIAPAGNAATVERGHCNRCERCGFTMDETRSAGCRPNDCSMRPLPARRSHCAGCGAEYSAKEGA